MVEFRKYAAYLAWKLGHLVDYWAPVNEPMVVAANGYVNVPGAIGATSRRGVSVLRGQPASQPRVANAAAYTAIHERDRRARVGPVHNMVAFTPADPFAQTDRRGAEHADYLFNRLYLNAVVRGEYDRDADGVIEAGERVKRRAGKADFIGVNYYFRGRVTGLDAPLSRTIQVLDFLPTTFYRTEAIQAGLPARPRVASSAPRSTLEAPCEVLRTAGCLRRPVIVTENGIADADDDQSPATSIGPPARRARRHRPGRRACTATSTGLMDNFESG